jgi:hypothetical protein
MSLFLRYSRIWASSSAEQLVISSYVAFYAVTLIAAGGSAIFLVESALSQAVLAGLGEKDWSIMADVTICGDDSLASPEGKSEKMK